MFIRSCGQSPEVEVYSTRLHPGMDLGISLADIVKEKDGKRHLFLPM